ncbi:hypothetical protein Aocu_13360 [Acholeplasma oculi]|uniref:Uncharacterized protein n=1 Tax=Acholeplasma oculi TaxID=35623 RepID=A0A061ADA1_9MOLU|nr:hypothetical protein Aocu_13360 [Acholeplasma oculi]
MNWTFHLKALKKTSFLLIFMIFKNLYVTDVIGCKDMT